MEYISNRIFQKLKKSTKLAHKKNIISADYDNSQFTYQSECSEQLRHQHKINKWVKVCQDLHSAFSNINHVIGIKPISSAILNYILSMLTYLIKLFNKKEVDYLLIISPLVINYIFKIPEINKIKDQLGYDGTQLYKIKPNYFSESFKKQREPTEFKLVYEEIQVIEPTKPKKIKKNKNRSHSPKKNKNFSKKGLSKFRHNKNKMSLQKLNQSKVGLTTQRNINYQATLTKDKTQDDKSKNQNQTVITQKQNIIFRNINWLKNKKYLKPINKSIDCYSLAVPIKYKEEYEKLMRKSELSRANEFFKTQVVQTESSIPVYLEKEEEPNKIVHFNSTFKISINCNLQLPAQKIPFFNPKKLEQQNIEKMATMPYIFAKRQLDQAVDTMRECLNQTESPFSVPQQQPVLKPLRMKMRSRSIGKLTSLGKEYTPIPQL